MDEGRYAGRTPSAHGTGPGGPAAWEPAAAGTPGRGCALLFRQWRFPQSSCPSVSPVRARLGAYVALTKPRIIELLLITTLPTMIVAQRGLPRCG